MPGLVRALNTTLEHGNGHGPSRDFEDALLGEHALRPGQGWLIDQCLRLFAQAPAPGCRGWLRTVRTARCGPEDANASASPSSAPPHSGTLPSSPPSTTCCDDPAPRDSRTA
ncbi:hypothetical protein AB0A05_35075 [Streptomyces sp. NPDC046374]|uniref:hypothetical protein n=1 Tax=Streptomyces sp. NPDC046374 TaxID=3154917 RepID=UPI0033D79257